MYGGKFIKRMANAAEAADAAHEEEGTITININADYASMYSLLNQDSKVCTTNNTASLEMFCVTCRYNREEFEIGEKTREKDGE